jgi:hypothetical protein
MEKLSYENILTNITLHQIDSTSLHLLFQRNSVYSIKCDKLSRFSLSFYEAWYQGKIKMSAISKEKIKIRVLTKIQYIWTE